MKQLKEQVKEIELEKQLEEKKMKSEINKNESKLFWITYINIDQLKSLKHEYDLVSN